jgi:tRNA-Thr(GGU) m(6)t(6)A37 methyltransferase TsaA
MDAELTLKPIGFVRSGKGEKFEARHQPLESEPEVHRLEWTDPAAMREAVRDLDGFSRIWLVWWFHRNRTWRPLVLPPRGTAQRRGVLATRSPHRPNPLGLTAVRLLGVEPGRLLLGAIDLVDGTPVFDVKPYIPKYDAFPDERSGWMEAVEAEERSRPGFVVGWSVLAKAQGEWLAAGWGVDFRGRMEELLSADPRPHRTRRIVRRGDRFEIACGAWRGVFRVSERVVTVEELQVGFPRRFLEDRLRTEVPEREAQLAFLVRWPEGGVEARRP